MVKIVKPYFWIKLIILPLNQNRGHEAIEARSHIFHLFAWGLPAIQSILVLALGKVEGKAEIN